MFVKFNKTSNITSNFLKKIKKTTNKSCHLIYPKKSHLTSNPIQIPQTSVQEAHKKNFLIIFPSFSSLHALSLILLVNSLENYIRLVFLIPFTTEKKFQFTTNTLLCFLLSFPMIYSKKKSISSSAPSTTIEKKKSS